MQHRYPLIETHKKKAVCEFCSCVFFLFVLIKCVCYVCACVSFQSILIRKNCNKSFPKFDHLTVFISSQKSPLFNPLMQQSYDTKEKLKFNLCFSSVKWTKSREWIVKWLLNGWVSCVYLFSLCLNVRNKSHSTYYFYYYGFVYSNDL